MFFNNKFNTFFGLNLTLVYTFPMCMAWRFHFPIRNYDFKARDKMHLKLTCTPATSNVYSILKHNLGVFNSILKKAIREAKISYYNMMFEKYKYDIKNTWKTISEVLSKANRKKKL